MSTTLASEAARQNARRKAFEQESKMVSGMLQEPDKLRSLAEKVSVETDGGSMHCFKTSKRRTVSPGYRNGLVNHAFHVEMDRLGALPSERSQACGNHPMMNIASLKAGPVSKRIMDSVDASNVFSKSDYRIHNQPSVLPTGASNKRVYVTQPPVTRRKSVDDRMTVTVFSSEKQSNRPSRGTLRPSCRPQKDQRDGMNPLTRSRRALSYPSPAFDSWQDELNYWKNALKTSSKLKALEK